MLGWDGPLQGGRHDETQVVQSTSFLSSENAQQITSFRGDRKIGHHKQAEDLKVGSWASNKHFPEANDEEVVLPVCGDNEERKHLEFAKEMVSHGMAPVPDDFEALEPQLSSWAFDVRASVQCQNQQLSSTDVIGTIAFDSSNEFFATGGIARKIRVYEYESLLSGIGPVDDDEDDEEEESVEYLKQRRRRKKLIRVSDFEQWKFTDHARCCVQEVCTPAKLSSLQWHQSRKNLISCGDYDGVVAEWDIEKCFAVSERDEHGGQRIWSINYSNDFPDLIASASDDGTVRMWDRSSEHSVAIIRSSTRSPVCCAEFGPASSSLLALASSDSNVYIYDIRKHHAPLLILRHHKRATSYVRFLSRHRLASSSIDSSVKLWDITSAGVHQSDSIIALKDTRYRIRSGTGNPSQPQNQLLKTFDAHHNVRNFTGFSVRAEGGLFACGSETNQAYIYDFSQSSPIFIHDFGEGRKSSRHNPGDGSATQLIASSGFSEATEYLQRSKIVSAVCWRRKPNDCSLVAANSDGVLRVVMNWLNM